jgi:hypothetical protein
MKVSRLACLMGSLALVASACTRQRPTTQPLPSGSFQFGAETPRDSALNGRFEGTAVLANGWMTVTIPRAVLDFPPGRAENWRNLTVRAFAATDVERGPWQAVAQSRPVNIFRFVEFAKTRDTDRRTLPIDAELQMMVPVPPGAALATTRLGIELEWIFIQDGYGETDSRIALTRPIAELIGRRP